MNIPDSEWITLTPVKPLAPGEYGVVILPKDVTLFSAFVYDFNVDLEGGKAEKK